jgi:hypothetical protein
VLPVRRAWQIMQGQRPAYGHRADKLGLQRQQPAQIGALWSQIACRLCASALGTANQSTRRRYHASLLFLVGSVIQVAAGAHHWQMNCWNACFSRTMSRSRYLLEWLL